jgi:hypothetical protein
VLFYRPVILSYPSQPVIATHKLSIACLHFTKMTSIYITPGVFVAVAIILAILFATGLGWCRYRKKPSPDIEDGYQGRNLENDPGVQDLGNISDWGVDK